MLSIQAVRGLARLRASGIVPCIISFSRQLPCLLVVRGIVSYYCLAKQCDNYSEKFFLFT